MEKKSKSISKNDPKDLQISNTMEPGQEFEPVKKIRVKTLGDAEFDQAIDSLIREMGSHA